MAEMMTSAKFLKIIGQERASWETLLSQVGLARMTEPGVEGAWSVKDIVAHVSAYEAWLVAWLQAASQGQLPDPSPLDDSDVDQRNAWIYAQYEGRPAGELLDEARKTFEALLEQLALLSDEDLTDPGRSEWFVRPYWKDGRPLWQCIAGDSYLHYHQHIPNIRYWLERVTETED